MNDVLQLVAQYPVASTVLAAVPVVQLVARAVSSVLGFLGKVRGKGPALPTLKKAADWVATIPGPQPAGPSGK